MPKFIVREDLHVRIRGKAAGKAERSEREGAAEGEARRCRAAEAVADLTEQRRREGVGVVVRQAIGAGVLRSVVALGRNVVEPAERHTEIVKVREPDKSMPVGRPTVVYPGVKVVIRVCIGANGDEVVAIARHVGQRIKGKRSDRDLAEESLRNDVAGERRARGSGYLIRVVDGGA